VPHCCHSERSEASFLGGDKFVHFDDATDVKSAIEREKQIEGWMRLKKNKLGETKNPNWEDLSEKCN